MPPYPVGIALLFNETVQAIRRNIGSNVFWIDPGARYGQRLFIDVRGKYLHRTFLLRNLDLFGDQHRYAVSLFACRAARYPDPYRCIRAFFLHKLCDNFLEGLECLGFAEKSRHPDQQVLKQLRRFIRMLPHMVEIGVSSPSS